MKKIISIILVLTLLASISVIFTSCDKKDNKNNQNIGGSSLPPSDDDENEESEDDVQDPVPVANQMLGLVLDLDEYDPDDLEKVYVKVDVPEFTDKVVYLISRVAIPGLSAKFKIVNDKRTEFEITLSEWTYDEARGIYYVAFNAPNAAGNAMYQVFTAINGVDSGRIYAVQVLKKMNVDPDGWV